MEFYRWALDQFDQGAIFINSDKIYMNFGGGRQRRQKVSLFEGEPAETLALPRPKPKFSFIFWGACYSDMSLPRPDFIWETETTEETIRYQKELDAWNARR